MSDMKELFAPLPASPLNEPLRLYSRRWEELGFGEPWYLAWINPLPNVFTIAATLDYDPDPGHELVIMVVWSNNERREGPGAEWYHFPAAATDGERLLELSKDAIRRIYEDEAREYMVYSDGIVPDDIDPCVLDFVRNPNC